MTNTAAAPSSDDHTGTFAVLAEALRTGRMTINQAQEQYRTSVRLYGAQDGQSIGIQRAISRHLRAVNSPW